MTPKVSVLLSVHNGGNYLKDAVESVLRQTYCDFEFLILDDGSTDGSTEYLDGLAEQDSRVRVIRQQNQGLVASLNRLITESRGSLLARMDADDICTPDRFQLQVQQFEHDPDLAVLGGRIEMIDPSGKSLGEQGYPLTARESEEMLWFGCPVAHPAVMMRRDVVVEIGGYRDFFAHCEDYDLWLRISQRAPIRNLDKVVLKYRVHQDSVSSSKRSEQLLGTYFAQAAWLMRRRGEPDPVHQWDKPSLELLENLRLPAEEKCLFMARWTLAAVHAQDHSNRPLVSEHLRKFPAIPPKLRQQGRSIKIRVYKELTLRAWRKGQYLQAFRWGLVLINLMTAFHLREFVERVFHHRSSSEHSLHSHK